MTERGAQRREARRSKEATGCGREVRVDFPRRLVKYYSMHVFWVTAAFFFPSELIFSKEKMAAESRPGRCHPEDY